VMLAARGFDLVSDMRDYLAPGSSHPELEELGAVCDVAASYFASTLSNAELADAVGSAICDVRGVEFEPGERFDDAEVCLPVIRAWREWSVR